MAKVSFFSITLFLISFLVLAPFQVYAVDCPPGFTPIGELCSPNNPFGGQGLANSTDVQTLGTKIINILLYVSGGLAVLFIILGGYWYITSGAVPDNAKKGKKTLIYAVIGLILVALSYAIVQTVTGLATK